VEAGMSVEDLLGKTVRFEDGKVGVVVEHVANNGRPVLLVRLEAERGRPTCILTVPVSQRYTLEVVSD
jgi:hypothetical protein